MTSTKKNNLTLRNISKNFYLKPLLKNWMFIIVVFCFLSLFFHHFQIITYPFQNEYREGAVVLPTHLLLKGGNPYALENQPEYSNMYGIFYNLIVYPFAWLFGESLIVHRIVTAFCIWGACFIFFLATRQMKVSLFLGLGTTLILYESLLRGTTPLARPDALGFLLFLGSILIPWKYKYSLATLISSIILSILAWLTKPYFLLSLPFLTSYIFLTKSKKEGIKYGVISFIFMTIAVLTINHFFSTYFTNAFFVSLNVGDYSSNKHLIKQLVESLRQNFLILLIPFIYINYLLWQILNNYYTLNWNNITKWLKSKLNFFDLDKPLIDLNLDLMTYGLFFFLTIFCLKLGKHSGNYMVYFYQLISPFLFWTILRFIRNKRQTIFIFSCLVTLTVFLLSQPFFVRLPDRSISDWKNFQELVSQHQNIYNSPPIVSILIDQDKKIYDSGLSQYFATGLERKSIWQTLFPTPKNFLEKNEQFMQNITESIISKKYDLMILTDGLAKGPKGKYFPSYFVSKELVQKYYEYQETLSAPMPVTGQIWKLDIWKPK